MSDKKYTREEEKFNVISHTVGILMSCVVGGIFLRVALNGGDIYLIVSVLLYVLGVSSSYVFSTAYHACSPLSPAKQLLRKLDHAAIYWHIAGCYSPVTLVALRESGYWGWGLFVFVWLCAVVGTVLSLRRLKTHNRLETVCYVLMGMLVLVAFKPLMDAVPISVIAWLIAEGVCYVAGAVLYSFHRVKYMHSVFHVFVLLGDICHMLVVWYVLAK